MAEQRKLKDYSTEELEQLLRRMTLSRQPLNMKKMDAILGELKRREAGGTSPERALQEFYADYDGRESAYLDLAATPLQMEQQISGASRKKAGSKKKKKKNGFRFAAQAVSAAIVVLVLAGSFVLGRGILSSRVSDQQGNALAQGSSFSSTMEEHNPGVSGETAIHDTVAAPETEIRDTVAAPETEIRDTVAAPETEIRDTVAALDTEIAQTDISLVTDLITVYDISCGMEYTITAQDTLDAIAEAADPMEWERLEDSADQVSAVATYVLDFHNGTVLSILGDEYVATSAGFAWTNEDRTGWQMPKMVQYKMPDARFTERVNLAVAAAAVEEETETPEASEMNFVTDQLTIIEAGTSASFTVSEEDTLAEIAAVASGQTWRELAPEEQTQGEPFLVLDFHNGTVIGLEDDRYAIAATAYSYDGVTEHFENGREVEMENDGLYQMAMMLMEAYWMSGPTPEAEVIEEPTYDSMIGIADFTMENGIEIGMIATEVMELFPGELTEVETMGEPALEGDDVYFTFQDRVLNSIAITDRDGDGIVHAADYGMVSLRGIAIGDSMAEVQEKLGLEWTITGEIMQTIYETEDGKRCWLEYVAGSFYNLYCYAEGQTAVITFTSVDRMVKQIVISG